MDLPKREMDRFLSLGRQAVRAASQYLLDHWGRSDRVEQKESHHSIVSEEDLRSEEIIIDFLDKALPGHSFISEERGRVSRRDEFVWVVDPLDGSSYYVRGLPSFSVSLALLHAWQPILGIVACPSGAELFTALKGGGSYCNDKPVAVSSLANLRDSILSFSHSFLRAPPFDGARSQLVPSCRSIRGGGSCAQELCYVACGRVDGFVAPAQSIWDFAAGALMVEEAGGRFTGFAGDAPDYAAWRDKAFSVVASNGLLHDRIRETLSHAPRS